jgi:tetratricopeptide (TPR) repeat protein
MPYPLKQRSNRQPRRHFEPDNFAKALRFHQAGELPRAERLYRRILATAPGHIAALSNLGMALLTQGRVAEAVGVLRRANALQPEHAQSALNFAEALRVAGALEEALAAYRRASVLLPPSGVVHNNIGVVLSGLGRPEEALAAFCDATRINPQYSDAHANAGRLLLQAHAPREAAACLRIACSLQPAAAYLADLALALGEAGDIEDGIAACHEAMALDALYMPARLNLAHLLVRQRRYADAAETCQAGLLLAPNNADFHCTFAAAAVMTGQYEKAIAASHRAIALQPRLAAAWFNLGLALERRGDHAGAGAAQREALAIDPAFAGAELKLAHALLAQGDYAAGWEHFEARWRTAEHVSLFQHLIAKPCWRGEKLNGARILLHWEQGYGDTLMLLRYVPLVVAHGGTVFLIVQPALQSIAAALPGLTLVTDPDDLPVVDLHCPLFSLPGIFGTAAQVIPSSQHYLAPDADLVSQWQQRIHSRNESAVRRIGLVWAGSADHKGDATRSIPLPDMAPLLGVSGVQWFSLQRDLRPGDAEWLAGPGATITQLGPDLRDFAHTAAVLASLDLLITVDTAVCHLAGALGVPTWLLLPAAPEWRWALDGERSRWYHSVQPWRHDGEWAELIRRIAAGLEEGQGSALDPLGP